MRRFLLLLSIVPLVACELFQSKEVRVEREVEQRLDEIDWDQVDTYPLFEGACSETMEKEVQKTCFLEQMFIHFSEAFKDVTFEVESDINETLYVDFEVDENGFIYLLHIEENTNVKTLVPDLNQQITKRLNDIITVVPALKQGTPVSVRFRLPILLNTNN